MAFLLLALTAACCLRRFVQAYTFTDLPALQAAIDAWDANPAAAENKYGSIEDWDTSEVTVMTGLFANCGTASSFNEDLNNWDLSSLTQMQMMFVLEMMKRSLALIYACIV